MSATSDEGSFSGVEGRRIVWRSWSPAGDQPSGGGYDRTRVRRARRPLRVCRVASDLRGLRGLRARPPRTWPLQGQGGPHLTARRGHGPRSLRGHVAEAQNSPDPLPQFLLGHSMGGTIALRYAIAHQDRLTGMVVSAPLAAVDGGPALWRREATRRGRARRAGEQGRPAAGQPRPECGGGLHRRPAELSRADPRRRRPPVRVVRRVAAGRCQRITLPTLLLWGTADRLCPPRGAEAIAANIGSSDFTAKFTRASSTRS